MFWDSERGHLLHAFLPSVLSGKLKKKIKNCFILAQPKPALQHSAVLDSSISSDYVSVWMSTISRFSCTDPKKKKCSERHTQKQGMGKEGSGSPGAGEQRRVQRKHDGTRYEKKKKTHLKHWLTKIWSKNKKKATLLKKKIDESIYNVNTLFLSR